MYAFRVDSIYPGLNCGGFQEFLLLALRLILVVRQTTQYIFYGWSSVKPEKNSIFLKKGKTVILIENRKFYKS